MKDDNFKINVQISGLRLPLSIPRSDEEMYRKAEKMVVKYIDLFQRQYPQRPSEEILILVAFKIAVLVSKQELSENIIPLADKIQSLDQELAALLNQ